MRSTAFLVLLLIQLSATSQQAGTLTIEKIMKDAKWMGTSPSNVNWSYDSKYLYFNWNPDNATADSLYYITVYNTVPVKVTSAQKKSLLRESDVVYNKARTACTFVREGDIYYTDFKTGNTQQLMETTEAETDPEFSFNETKLVYTRNQNLYAFDIKGGQTIQLTNFVNGSAPAAKKDSLNKQEQWLKNDQLSNFDVLKQRREKADLAEAYEKSHPAKKELRKIYLDEKTLRGLTISPDGRFVSYTLYKAAKGNKTTIVPSYVTETGFTTDIPGRTKVGEQEGTGEFFIYDRLRDTVWKISTAAIPGIKDLPDYVKDYPVQLEKRTRDSVSRMVSIASASWSPSGSHLVLNIFSQDNKDRWLMLWDTATRALNLLDRQRDEAWIGGPGISSYGSNTGWIDEDNFWYQSEATGYSHLYSVNVSTKAKKAYTSGNYEVQVTQLSNDKKYFYITTNAVHPGEKHFYRLAIAGGNATQITNMTGGNQVTLSPDEKTLAILYSTSNKPWELYLQQNSTGTKFKISTPVQITNKAQSDEFKSYPWRVPELVNFTARDGAVVYARLYKPNQPDVHKPAVIFVHGAGYLQNAHKWWSSYFREYMFHNMLTDNGYYVMDIDYRGSAGYGRNWRTGIYRHMGGRDLDDNVDAAGYLTKNFGVDNKRIGIYGGSYGGFITLMGLFTTPDVFAAGAALRPVTDWANYNHGYTTNILNEPFNDSLAYRNSSPFYFANGLKNNLLICHGMVDVNVHFADAVKLSQRLIELGKDNWELAAYPLEDHGFVEPSSWTDEYKRIFKLFEQVLKR